MQSKKGVLKKSHRGRPPQATKFHQGVFMTHVATLGMTPSAAAALSQLRDPATFQWYVIPFLLIVLYLYGEQAAEKRWDRVLAGIAFWLMDWINEIWNGLLFHFSGYAPAWGTPGPSAFELLIGLNIEICFMFLVMGLFAVRTLPVDRNLKIFGINNRAFLACLNSVLCVIVEVLLNRAGALTWEWHYWNARYPLLIFLIGYLPFFMVAFWVHDMSSMRRQVGTVICIGGIVAASLAIFGGMLGWI
jgi:hypothetical protein